MPSSRSHSYVSSAYDANMCLKPPLLLWLAVLFLSRAITLPIVIGIGHVAGVNTEAMMRLRDLWSPDELLPAVLSIPVLYAFCRRIPTASTGVRWIWSHGRILLALSAGIDILSMVGHLWHGESGDWKLPSLFTIAPDVYVLTYVLAARRVRDTFLDFP